MKLTSIQIEAQNLHKANAILACCCLASNNSGWGRSGEGLSSVLITQLPASANLPKMRFCGYKTDSV